MFVNLLNLEKEQIVERVEHIQHLSLATRATFYACLQLCHPSWKVFDP